MSVKIDIISGFLGAGKTTMIKKLLDEGVLEKQIAIIENEFGDINVDSHRLDNPGFSIEIKSISSGCICCTLAGEFNLAIKDLIEKHSPKRIIIEPTGVGKLSDILYTINKVKEYENIELNIVMTIVDASEFEDFIEVFGNFFTDQIRNATTIALSKTQLTDESKVNRVINSIREINYNGNIIATPWDKLEASHILEVAEPNKETVMNDDNKLNICCNGHDECNFEDNSIQKQFEFCSLETMKKYNETNLNKILNTLNDNVYGEVYRAKGIVLNDKEEWVDFDFIPKKANIAKGNIDTIGKVIVIGRKLNKDAIKSLFN